LVFLRSAEAGTNDEQDFMTCETLGSVASEESTIHLLVQDASVLGFKSTYELCGIGLTVREGQGP